ncbi:XRE family transcriptional regulator [Flavobacterium arcticum]|uniref:XRE family transcriptional regulator n=1 Tax=Flavobacterium arcticum TaxID=1784713 RepID=A0A345HAR3_9FLAO|nr:helix-turn-helix domain-containing protein [Flavobacterium arcticum]AXG73673.1 XRE family transcriptional regulator [Flavobacterium arcticum]KAF2511624.1 helix-turn-helix domain-containing protein [Flavobacterium arcticum]
MTTIGKKIATIRKQKGLTQEEVAETANINLRTLQRIEKDETEPRGNSLNGICSALGIAIEDILDYGKNEDKSYLIFLHLSILSFCVIPLGNIILPLILWLNKRDKITDVQQQGANIINFQIMYTFITYGVLLFAVFSKLWNYNVSFNGILLGLLAVSIFNFIYAISNAIRINRGIVKNFYPVLFRIVK